MTGVSTSMAGICNRPGTERPRACTVFAEGREGRWRARGPVSLTPPASLPAQPASSEAVAAVTNARREAGERGHAPVARRRRTTKTAAPPTIEHRGGAAADQPAVRSGLLRRRRRHRCRAHRSVRRRPRPGRSAPGSVPCSADWSVPSVAARLGDGASVGASLGAADEAGAGVGAVVGVAPSANAGTVLARTAVHASAMALRTVRRMKRSLSSVGPTMTRRAEVLIERRDEAAPGQVVKRRQSPRGCAANGPTDAAT